MGLRGLEGAKPSQVDGFEVSWRDEEGEHRLPLADAVSVEFETGRPVRGFPSYRGQRHFPGLYWSSTTGRHVGFESWLERDHAMLLDFTPQVTGLLSQPLWLFWTQPVPTGPAHVGRGSCRCGGRRGCCCPGRKAGRTVESRPALASCSTGTRSPPGAA
ncbi:TnsA-like heteromeric transposase endonuclease subunit [Streptomyces sp. NPDC006649]|uniref:TnsA-like heteromeric transposase endonuclease subunit n=1 Tax=Streptomyces sp. NPDC006649 TaxID=3156896 RepID=UPI0033B3F3CA